MLRDYLHNEFINRNHKKYHHYFETWYNKLTENQRYYFNKEYEKWKKLKK